MPRTSVQDVLLEEIRSLREDSKNHTVLLAKVATTMEAVEVQTTKTNGRVNDHEKILNQQRGWIKAIILVGSIILTLIPIIITIHQIIIKKG